MSMADLRTAQAEVHAVKITDDTIDALIQIRDACKAEGIVASDRRWKKSLRLAQAVAYMAGEKKTSPEDLAILVDSLWREPKDRPKVKAGSLGHRPLYFPNLAEIFGGPGGTRTHGLRFRNAPVLASSPRTPALSGHYQPAEHAKCARSVPNSVLAQ